MPLFLTKRDRDAREKMDNPDCDRELLFNTYRQFETVNKLVGGWSRIYKNFLRPVLKEADKKPSLLDIGCGGGDLVSYLAKLSKQDGLDLQITGIDPDPRAIEFAHQNNSEEHTRFLNIDSTELAATGNKFDIVISNHLLHHLTETELLSVCIDAEQLTRRLALFNDIERSDIGFTAFSLVSPIFFRNSFISEDGITSIKRSYRQHELQQALPDHWQVKRLFPFRLLALFEK